MGGFEIILFLTVLCFQDELGLTEKSSSDKSGKKTTLLNPKTKLSIVLSVTYLHLAIIFLIRSRLSYEQFGAFLGNVKDLNAHKQTREVRISLNPFHLLSIRILNRSAMFVFPGNA